jgi:ATP-dependent exoDNAse (exonuclease V) alpha subunit
MTVNKAQGQTLDRVGIYLPDHVFSHGQLYVALSRARQAASIKVSIN